MADSYAVFISNCTLLSNARIRQAVEGARVQFFAEDEGHTEHANWIRFDIRWPDGTVKVDRPDIRRPDFAEQLQQQCAFVREAGSGQMDPRRALLEEKILRSHSILRMSGPPECVERMETFARTIAAESNALLLFDDALWDPKGKLCLDKDGESDPGSGWAVFPSALARKARSEERLRSNLVPVLDSLPPIESEEESLLRPPWEVARRASALVTVAARAEGLEQQRAMQFLQAWGLWDAASVREQAFLLNPQPAETDRVQFLWKYECLWVMLWALGHVEALGMPTSICDVRRAVKTVTGTTTDIFIGRSELRPLNEILDEADLIYRCHWALKEAYQRGEQPPAGLDRGVVIERHIALNWLRTHHSQSWDNVTPDV